MSYKENLKRWYITFYSVTLISKGCRGRIIPNFTELEVLKKMIGRTKQKLLARVEWEPLRDKIGRGLWFWIFGYSSLLNTFLCKYYLSQPGCRLFALKKKKRVFTKKEAHNSQENRVIGSVECQAASPFSYSNTAVKGSWVTSHGSCFGGEPRLSDSLLHGSVLWTLPRNIVKWLLLWSDIKVD